MIRGVGEELAEAGAFTRCEAIVELIGDLGTVELEYCELGVERRGFAGNSASLVGRHISVRTPFLLSDRRVVEARPLLLGVESGIAAVLVRVVDLVDQEGVVDAEYLILKEGCVHLLVLLVCLVDVLVVLASIDLCAVPLLLHLCICLVDGEELNLGAEDVGGVVVEGALGDKAVAE